MNKYLISCFQNLTKLVNKTKAVNFFVALVSIGAATATRITRVAFAINPNDIFGTIEPPPGVDRYQAEVGTGNIGIILFASNVVRMVTIAAGIWVLFNIIFAGWLYITSPGDSSAHEKVSNKLINSFVGLAIIALSYTIAGLIGFLIFGDAGFILNPEFKSVLD